MRTAAPVALGFLLGLGLILGVGPEDEPPPPVTSVPSGVKVPPEVALLPQPPAEGVALVWTPGGLPADLAATVRTAGGVQAVAEAKAGLAYLVSSRAADGANVDAFEDDWVIPIEVTVFDPVELAAFDPEAAEVLAQDLVLLSQSSARLRRIGVGGEIVLEGGGTVTVGAVVDDVLFGASEMVVSPSIGAELGVDTARYLLVRFGGGRAELEASIRGAIPSATSLRLRGPGETPYLRHGDAVLPQAVVKSLFGEFTIRPTNGEVFEIDPEWQAKNLVTAEVPLVGRVTCHRTVLPLLAEVMADIDANRLSHLVDPSGFQGCFNPRFIAGGVDLSHHAWGIAVDVNHIGNEQGLSATVDPRLVEAFKTHGFGWGGDWLLPDPAHFEWVGG